MVQDQQTLNPASLIDCNNADLTPIGTATDNTVVVPIRQGTELLALQIQAFLRASQDEELDGDAEIDEEIVQDILSVLSSGSEGNDLPLSNCGDLSTNDEFEGDDDEDFSWENNADSALGESDTGVIGASQGTSGSNSYEASPSSKLQKHDIKTMLRLLKERGPAEFISEYVHSRLVPIPDLLEALGVSLRPELRNRKPKTMLYFLHVAMAHVRRKREKLARYNTIEDAVRLIDESKRILVLTGAGISVSCGIPDFRSRDGLYASIKSKGEFELDDPQQMFDIDYFRENPAVFYSFASQIYPSNFEPSPCHRFIKLLEDKSKLLRNYTQNIDTLETRAGVRKVLQCHGSFATASCLKCRRRVDGRAIECEILDGKVPFCVACSSVPASQSNKVVKQSKKKKKGEWDSDCEDESPEPEIAPGVMKPDITFFGEKLSDEFDRCVAEDRFMVDLLLVIGTSLNVSPVAEILSHLPHSIPQILINKTPVRHINPDIILLGNADDIVIALSERLGWELPPRSKPNRTLLQVPRKSGNLKKRPSEDGDIGRLGMQKYPSRVGESHVWLFEGAEGGKWLSQLQQKLGIVEYTGPSVDGGSAESSVQNSDDGRSYRQQAVINGGGEGDERRETKKQKIA